MCNLLFFLRRMKKNLPLGFVLWVFFKHFLELPEPETKILGLGRGQLSSISEDWVYPVSLETSM